MSMKRMNGRTVVVTGANSGIGKATAMELARRQARVIMAVRDVKAGNKAASEIRKKYKYADLSVKELDLASIASIRKFSQDLIDNESRLDVLINNAGVYHCAYSHTADKLETQMGVNHFGHFLLTNLLLPKLKQSLSLPARIVVVSSGLSKYGEIDFDNLHSQVSYDKSDAYNNSKLANNLFARELSTRIDADEVSVYCLRPGMVRSNLGRHTKLSQPLRILLYPLAWLLVKNCWEGCQTVVHCSVAEELEGDSGAFYGDCEKENWNDASLDWRVAKRLWNESCIITGVKNEEEWVE